MALVLILTLGPTNEAIFINSLFFIKCNYSAYKACCLKKKIKLNVLLFKLTKNIDKHKERGRVSTSKFTY